VTGEDSRSDRHDDGEPPPRSNANDRKQGADDRDQTAEDRDQISAAYDKASETRDQRAEDRDRRAEARDRATSRLDPGAVSDRAGAWRDRRGAAGDRRHAADDREAASTDRVMSAHERADASIDELTGAYRRDAGMVELAREMARAKRTKDPLVLAFVDVDGLKETNDTRGHAAGDRVLCTVVDAIKSHLRSYDLVVRYGGDEFVCAFLDMGIEEVAERFLLINGGLAASPGASISVGLAELVARDSLEDLIGRADVALRDHRRGHPSPRFRKAPRGPSDPTVR
jgi:diguanylate cyclase (GGDEF)-like protein